MIQDIGVGNLEECSQPVEETFGEIGRAFPATVSLCLDVCHAHRLVTYSGRRVEMKDLGE